MLAQGSWCPRTQAGNMIYLIVVGQGQTERLGRVKTSTECYHAGLMETQPRVGVLPMADTVAIVIVGSRSRSAGSWADPGAVQSLVDVAKEIQQYD